MAVDLTEPAPAGTDARTAFIDALFEVLCNERRRFLLHQLRESDGRVDLPTVARRLIAYEDEIPQADVTNTDQRRAYNALYQTHVPKLERHGLVTYDKESRTVTVTTDRFDLIRQLEGRHTGKRGVAGRHAATLAAFGWLGTGMDAASLGDAIAVPLVELVAVSFAIGLIALSLGPLAARARDTSGLLFAEFDDSCRR